MGREKERDSNHEIALTLVERRHRRFFAVLPTWKRIKKKKGKGERGEGPKGFSVIHASS